MYLGRVDVQQIEGAWGPSSTDAARARARWLASRGARVESEGEVVRVAVPTMISVRGAPLSTGQLVSGGASSARASVDQVVAVGARVIAGLGEGGAQAVFAVPSEEWPAPALEALGLTPAFDLSLRNFYLSFGALSDRLEVKGPHPLRKVAAFARRIRQKMIEVNFESGWLEDAARVHAERRPALGLSVVRDLPYLTWRYRDAPARSYRMLVLRSHAGAGIDGYAVVEPLPSDADQVTMRVIDHWSRSADRVGDSRFMFELALWFLSEQVTVVQALGVQGSALDGLFMRTGGFKKAWSSHLWWRPLDARGALPVAAETALRASDFLDY